MNISINTIAIDYSVAGKQHTFIMVHIRTILTLSIAILAVDNVLVEAGKATENRIANLSKRAEVHKETLRLRKDDLEKKFGSMTDTVKDQLTEISNIIIDHIMDNKSFAKYLKNVFSILRKYAVRQLNTRYGKLKNIYKKWEKQNFPNKKEKAQALKILEKQEKENKALQKKNGKKLQKNK
ncbi:uncharacterized protein LOC100164853 [Acyrthosiphon pisum]|uniref:Uncharacterized protein n=1 Tax=Acyrthosiphon pisum TaxID=7029 RepID=A0A8R1W5P0_ACYPI|nr:uncharacterized protein LOC100164853 [Acyrthosiphon pisum]|eukprot:XP_001946678.2 PREDICTED: uncharacterized protein LOC100164853 [Acyrthosiphon pisum]